MVDVFRLGHAHDWMEQQRGVKLPRSPRNPLLVEAVHRTTWLERDDAGASEGFEAIASLSRRKPKLLKVVAPGQPQDLQSPRHVEVAPAHHLSHERMRIFTSAQDTQCLLLPTPVGRSLPHP